MNAYGHHCRALIISAGATLFATLLTACGSHAGGTIPAVSPLDQTFSHSQTFKFTGKPQRFKVPHARWLRVVVRGAAGAAGSSTVRGGRVYALIPASIDGELVVYVGGAGNLAQGGYNGGGDGGPDKYCSNCAGYGGGGASDIRLSTGALGDRVIVAGGGGGSGGSNSDKYSGGAGGRGGGSTGASGQSGAGTTGYGECAGQGGGGGSQIAGGAGGSGGRCSVNRDYNGSGGGFGDGGTGGTPYGGGAGGGGGGGFYGGGGGGGGSQGYSSYGNYVAGGGGGGGGSSFVGKRATHSHVWQGWKDAVGNGLVVISW
jgi:hypothetical protein